MIGAMRQSKPDIAVPLIVPNGRALIFSKHNSRLIMKIHCPMIVLASLVFSLSAFAENQSPKPNASCDTACIK
jgi:hypothetical protein